MKIILLYLSVFVLSLGVSVAKPVVKGSGNIKKETRIADGFTRIVVSNAIQLVLTASDAESVIVEAEDNILPFILVEVSSDKLEIKMKETHNYSNEKEIKVYVSYKHLFELFVSGASKVTATNAIKEEKLLLILSGASQADLNIQSQWLSVNCSGASKGVIAGSTEKLNIQCAGASNVNAQKLSSIDADVDASGASSILLETKTKLNITASGASIVRYLSEANTQITKEINGASSVIALNDKSE